jgi:hypothetical protein
VTPTVYVRHLTVALAALSITACAAATTAGAGDAASVPGPAGFPPAAAPARLSEHRVVNGATFDPPASSDLAQVSAATAYATCAQDGVCDNGSAPTIQLARFSIPEGATVHGVVGAATNVLAYVMTWPSARCSPCGPAKLTITTCSLYNIVAADDGKVILSFSLSN